MVSAELLDKFCKNSLDFVSPVKTCDLVSFKVGGTGDVAVFPKSTYELKLILDLIKNEKFVEIYEKLKFSYRKSAHCDLRCALCY